MSSFCEGHLAKGLPLSGGTEPPRAGESSDGFVGDAVGVVALGVFVDGCRRNGDCLAGARLDYTIVSAFYRTTTALIP